MKALHSAPAAAVLEQRKAHLVVIVMMVACDYDDKMIIMGKTSSRIVQ